MYYIEQVYARLISRPTHFVSIDQFTSIYSKRAHYPGPIKVQKPFQVIASKQYSSRDIDILAQHHWLLSKYTKYLNLHILLYQARLLLYQHITKWTNLFCFILDQPVVAVVKNTSRYELVKQ